MRADPLLRSQPWLGTLVEICIDADADREDLVAASDQGFGCVRRIHAAMSFHEPDSELSRVNRDAASGPVPVSKHLHEVLSLALGLSAASGGIFDVSIAPRLVRNGGLFGHLGSVPENGDWRDIELRGQSVAFRSPLWIDLGGIAKGYAVDLAFEAIMACLPSARQISVNAGGDLRVLNWEDETVHVRFRRFWGVCGSVPVGMKAPAMASSGAHAQGGVAHLIDPLGKRRLSRGKVFTVFAERCILADALTKVACLTERPANLLRRFGASAVSINRFGRVMGVA